MTSRTEEKNSTIDEFNILLNKSSTNNENRDKPNWRDTIPQILASCIAYGIVIQAGVNMAYSTVLIGGLELEKNQFTINEAESSWIASLVTLFTPIGSLIVGPLMDKFGRKIICMATCIPIIISWTLLIFAKSLSIIYCARIIAGLSAGLTTVSLVYCMEITHPNVRGMLLCFNSVFVSLGILLTCFFALFLKWHQIAIVFLSLNIIFFFALIQIPESPYWLVYFGKESEDNERLNRAKKSLKWLNPNSMIYQQEYSRIQEINSLKHGESGKKSSGIFSKKFWKLLLTPGVYKPIFLLLIILFIQQLSGCYVVIFYAISVFRDVGGKFGHDLNEYGALVLLGIIRFVMSVLTAFLSKNIGRRLLCIISGFGMSFSMFYASMYLYAPSIFNEDNVFRQFLEKHNWSLLVVVLFYVCTSSLGFVNIPWTLIGELLPISFRGMGGGILISVAYMFMFLVVKNYPYALISCGAKNVFLFFGIMSLIGVAFVYFFLPETLGKSFSEIEQYFSGPKSVQNRKISNP